jgi:hypothetical protein
MRRHRIAAIPGDGIGVEVIAAGLEALEACARRYGGFSLTVETFPLGSDHHAEHGAMMPADGLERLKAFDAIFFRSVGAPQLHDHVTLWGLHLAICQPFDQYADLRPVRLLPGIDGPLKNASTADLDWIILRENSKGEYSGHGGRAHRSLPEEVGTEVSIFPGSGMTLIVCRFIIAPLSNGKVVCLMNMAIFARLPRDLILSAESFQHNKPGTKTYLGCSDMLSLEPGQVVPVAAHDQDIAAAQSWPEDRIHSTADGIWPVADERFWPGAKLGYRCGQPEGARR